MAGPVSEILQVLSGLRTGSSAGAAALGRLLALSCNTGLCWSWSHCEGQARQPVSEAHGKGRVGSSYYC